MKLFVFFLAAFIGLAAFQDVSVPGDLLNRISSTPADIDVEYEDTEPTPEPLSEPQTEEPPDAFYDRRTKSPPVNGNFKPLCETDERRGSNNQGYWECDIVTPYPGRVHGDEEDQDPFPGRDPGRDRDYSTQDPNRDLDDYEPPEEEIVTQTANPITSTVTVPTYNETEYNCPIGKVQVGNRCLPTSTKRCPRDQEERNGTCVKVEITCPLQFHREGSRCVQNPICPSFYKWQNGRCELTSPIDCPTGSVWSGNKCEVIVIDCEPGFILRYGECTREEIFCMPGEIQVGKECHKHPDECEPGYEVGRSGFCERITVRCREGYQPYNNTCILVSIVCPRGYDKVSGTCVKYILVTKPTLRTTRTTTTRPTRRSTWPTRSSLPIRSTDTPSIDGSMNKNTPASGAPEAVCPHGYNHYHSLCYKCRHGTNWTGNNCVNRDGGGSMPNININVYGGGNSRPSENGGKGSNIINNIQPVNNTIFNINNISHPVTLHNVNENNIYIYMDAQCHDGSIRTIVVKNNETTNGCTDVTGSPRKDGDAESDDNEEDKSKCCEVVTPRRCRERVDHRWNCIHRRYKYCGKFCIADRVYLKPHSTVFKDGTLTVAPIEPGRTVVPCFGATCPPVGKLRSPSMISTGSLILLNFRLFRMHGWLVQLLISMLHLSLSSQRMHLLEPG